MAPVREIQGLLLSERLYRLVLYSFPAPFREAYAMEAVELFRDRYREEYRRARMRGVLAYWGRVLRDTVVHGLMERWEGLGERIGRTGGTASRPSRRQKRSWRDGALRNDLACAARSLRTSPGFSALAVLTLAVGIGATTAMFSVVSGVLFHPLPYDKPDNLVAIYSRFTPESGRDIPKYAVGSPEYFDYVNHNRTMESVAAVSTELVTLTAGEGDPEIVTAGYVSASMFSVLRTPPLLGRTLVAADDGPAPEAVFVLGYGLWQRRFGGDPNVVGQSLEAGLEVESYQGSGKIVGVMPEGFAFPTPETELWTQLPLDPARTWRGGHWFSMIARLAPGITYEKADAEMEAMMAQWAEVYPEHHTGHGLFMMPLLDDVVGEVRPALLLLQGAVGFMLLIACVNVASLLLARAEGRRREVAVRSALGAGRGRIARQLLTESLVLASLGGVVGILLSRLGVNVALALAGGSIPRVERIGLDGQVLAFTAGVVLLASIIFGLTPALQAASADLSRAFKMGSRAATPSRERTRLLRFLIVVEVALAVLLVLGAGLMSKSYRRLLQVDPGFRMENLLAVHFSLPAAKYSPEQAMTFYSRLIEDVEGLPGVSSAAVASRPPLYSDRSSGRIQIEGRPDPSPDEWRTRASGVMAGQGLFETLAIPLKRGRLLDETDRPGAPLSVVIDEEMARQYWPDAEPIGERFRFARTDGPWNTIVGVVGNVKFDGLAVRCPTYYNSHEQAVTWMGPFVRTMTLMMRAAGNPSALAGPVKEVVRRLDPSVPIVRMQTMDEIYSAAVAGPRFTMSLLGAFAGIALLLGTVGVYGVMSHAVVTRTGEIGIRMAMGAGCGTVSRMVLGQGAGLALLGVIAGLAAALAATRVMEGLLFEVSTTDPWTFGSVAAVMTAVGLLASYLPARRASHVDPLTALRVE